MIFGRVCLEQFLLVKLRLFSRKTTTGRENLSINYYQKTGIKTETIPIVVRM